MSPLIDAGELVDRLDQIALFDIRWDLTNPGQGRRDYEAGHIPGAIFVDLDDDLAAPPGHSGRHPLPDVETFAATLGRLGISPTSEVIVYDDDAGRKAARMWWMLRAIGHEHVRVLDGGFQAWDGEIETRSNTPRPAWYPVPVLFDGVARRHELAGRVLIDARASDRYRGDVEPVDPKAGHIPGAVNIPTSHNLTDDGRFRDEEALAEIYAHLPRHGVVVSCGSGVTACHDALAMVVAGHPMPDVYVGSFSEWSRQDLPVATGPNP